MKAVHLHIDRIVVDGLPEARQRQFARALDEQLRQWAASGAASEMTGNRRVRIPALNAWLLKPGATASEAARQVVNSVARLLGAIGQSGNARGPANAGGQEARGHV